MNSIDRISTQNGLPINSGIQIQNEINSGSPEDAGASAPNTGNDSVEISKGESLGKKIAMFPFRAVKETTGIIMGVADAALGTIPSALGGIESALSVSRPDPASGYTGHKGEANGGYVIGHGLQAASCGAVAGGFIGGPWGVLIGGAGGLVLGLIKLGVDHEIGVVDRVSKKISEKTYEPIIDNVPTQDKMYDAGKNVSEGGIIGMKTGIVENFNVGREKADGVFDGIWEGTKGFTRTIFHTNHEASESKEQEAPKTFGQKLKDGAMFVISLPKEMLKFAFGTVFGTAGALMTLPDGLIEGIGQGVTHHGNADRIHMSKGLHRGLIKAETALMGAAAGACAGPIGTVGGAIAGALGGLIVGMILSKIERVTETDKQIIEGMENHLKREISDNKELGSRIANGHRDAIEGAMTGTAAGLREGFSAGYDAGAGFVQGVSDAVVGVAKGLKGAIKELASGN